jgi:erythromycin 12 hydroxylase
MTTPTNDQSYFNPQPVTLQGNGWGAMVRWMDGMRDQRPVHEHCGVYHVFRADDVRRVLSDTETFSSDRTPLMPPTAQLGRGNLTMMDPPDHTRIRKIVNQAFTPRLTHTLAGAIQGIADELVGDLHGQFDIVSQLAYPLPVRVISRLLGLASSDMHSFSSWSAGFSRGDAEQMNEMHEYLNDVAKHKRRCPGSDLMSTLVESRVEGEQLSRDEVASLAGLILLAGHVTTTSLIAASVLELVSSPEIEKAVRRSDKVHHLVEETLRVRPAFAQVVRITSQKTNLSGRPINTGAVIAGWILSANYDPSLNLQPSQFQLDRHNRRYLSFGHGVHYCLGSSLAKLEAEISVKTLLARFPNLKQVEVAKFHSQPTLSVKRLVLSQA